MNELERTYYPGICLGDYGNPRKLPVTVAGVPAEIRTGHFPGKCSEVYMEQCESMYIYDSKLVIVKINISTNEIINLKLI
jgi:hypothetical protein